MPFYNGNSKDRNGAGGSSSDRNVVVGLDIGTSKVCALIAEPDNSTPGADIKILGCGVSESFGLNRGVVVNIDKTVETIKIALDEAEKQAGIKVSEVIVGIAGDHIESFETNGVVGVSNENQIVSKHDVERLIEETKKLRLPPERKILHVIPQEFVVDGQDGISEPVGMSGVRLAADVHVVTGLSTAVQNIYRCVELAGRKVKRVVLEPLASSYAALDEEEKEVGVALVDIGGGTTDIAIFEENVIRFTSVFGIAGKQVTDDIRKGLGILASQAEQVKREFGAAHCDSLPDDDDLFMIKGIGGRKPLEVEKSLLCQIIGPRMEEIFEFALAEIRRSGYSGSLGAGVVVTGGSSLIRGCEDLASEVFGAPVKIGFPRAASFSGLGPEIQSPVFSTAAGLALYGIKEGFHSLADIVPEPTNGEAPDHPSKPRRPKLNGKNIFDKVKKWVEEL